jgi:RimJ/RimL family protein N-acetyltransferase
MNLLNIMIETPQVHLVPIRLDHAEDIFRHFTPEITLYMYPKPAEEISDTIKFINSSLKGLETGTNLQLVILGKTLKEFIGCAGLHNVGQIDPELGIWIKRTSHGNGYGLETITAIISWARENIQFEYLRYPVDKRNYPSRRIPERNSGVVRKEYREMNQSGFELDEVEYWIFKQDIVTKQGGQTLRHC